MSTDLRDAVKIYRYDDTTMLDGMPGARIGLRVEGTAVPDPEPNQVLIRVQANALNFVDLLCLSGEFDVHGRVPLLDGAGIVVAVGSAVSRWKPGQRVVANPNQLWTAGEPGPDTVGVTLGLSVDGTLGEYIVLPEHGIVALPEALSFEDAASIPCAGLSAWNSLMGGPTRRAVAPGSTILTLGTGGVSLFAVQLAKAMGCRVIATTSSETKADQLTTMGADAVINYVETPDWGTRVLEITNGVGVDLVVEVGGPSTLPQSIVATKVGGRVAMVGIVGGMGSIDYKHLIPINHKTLTLYANGMGNRRDLEQLLQFIAITGIKPRIDSLFPFDEAADAMRHFASRGHVGKVLVTHEPPR